MDYFISADIMEHPYRTRMSVQDEPYTEQVVLIEGQGIWYLRPDIKNDLVRTNMKDRLVDVKVIARSEFQLQENWFVYLLPQSIFKIHPLYDLVMRDILQRVPHAHLVVLGGRKPRKEIFLTRLRSVFGVELS